MSARRDASEAGSDPNRPSAAELADALVAFVAGQIEALAEHHAPGLVLPRVFAGHPVGPDARSDLAHTLGLLFEAGITEIAGRPTADAALSTLRGLDGRRTDTFYSYRAAETLLRLGGDHGNPRLADLAEHERANLREAFDSSASVIDVREGRLPRNYAVVVARCEHARATLGLLEDSAILDELCERSRALLGQSAEGWIDDSNEQRGQYDIYTADIFLFAEPLAGRLGSVWADGLRRVLRDVDALALPGSAIVWGRSIGALGIALTIELAAIGVSRNLVANPEDWLARATWALREMRAWYSRGVIRAHQHRSTMFYRGPARRLQMTLDVLGKLVIAALDLRKLGDRVHELRAAPPVEAWRPVDRFVAMGARGRNAHAGAWAYRHPNLSFVLPLVGGFSSDYLPAPRAPGLFEVPTSGPISMLPVVHHAGRKLVAAGVPTRVVHRAGEVLVEYAGWAEVTAAPGAAPEIEGARTVRFTVEGRSLVVHETLSIAAPEDVTALALQVPELAQRPLQVELASSAPHRADVIDVEGLAEYRSFWSEIAKVHQIDVEPARQVEIRWRVTPQLRVASTAHGHGYDDALYRPLAGRLSAVEAVRSLADRPAQLRDTDVLHMHWPEWWQGPDLERNRHALDRLREAGTRIVWTMHNLVPHAFRDAAAVEVYELWAQAAHAVIHHSRHGQARALATYRFRDDAIHRVIPHGHWGDRFRPHALMDRARVEAGLGLAPCALRLGVVGAPRPEKNVQLVLDAFHACSRQDLQLLVLSTAGEQVPDDPRILALPNAHVEEHVYYQRLTAIDALVFPFSEGMLMTGTAFDAIGAEKAAITSDWPVLDEVFGESAIRYGSTREDLTACLETLSAADVRRSAAAMKDLQAQTAWPDIAEATLALIEEIAVV